MTDMSFENDAKQKDVALETTSEPDVLGPSTQQPTRSSVLSPTMPAMELADATTAGHVHLSHAAPSSKVTAANPDNSSAFETASDKTQTRDDDGHFIPRNLAIAAKKLWSMNDKPQRSTDVTESKAGDTTEEVIKEAREFMEMFQTPGGVVEVTIPSGKTFYLHVDILSDKSDYFCAALKGGFQETTTRRLTLKDVSDNTFAFFLKWLYGGTIQPDKSPIPKTCPVHRETALTWKGLIDLWFFADYLCAGALQNHIVDNMVYKMSNFYCHITDDRSEQIIDAVKLLWKPKARTDLGLLSSAKPLCDLLLDFVANPTYMPKVIATKTLKILPAAFIRECALRSVERSFEIRDQTDSLFETVRLHGPFCGCGCDLDVDDSEIDDIFDKLEMTESGIQDLANIWKIKAEKYYVKEGKQQKN